MSAEFNQSQRRMAEFTVAYLKQEQNEPKILVACGFKGVGKSTVLKSLEAKIEAANGRLRPLDFLLDPQNVDIVEDMETHFVTWGTPKQLTISQHYFVDKLGIAVAGIIVRPMTYDEAIQYIEKSREERGMIKTEGDFGNHELACLTLGIYSEINTYFDWKEEGRFYSPTNMHTSIMESFPSDLRLTGSLVGQFSNLPAWWMV